MKISSSESSSSIMKDQEALIEYLKNLTQDLNMPHLSKYGVTESDIPSIVEEAQKASSIKYNSIPLEEKSLTNFLMQAIH